MAEPVSSIPASAALAGAALLSTVPGMDAERVLGAFAGAVVFVLASQDLGLLRKAAFFFVAFVIGLLGAQVAAGVAAGVLTTLLPGRVAVSDGVGALMAAALVVKLLLIIIRKLDDADLLSLLRGGRS